MFDRVSQAAERLAANFSRRSFLGGLGRGAMAVACGLGGLLLVANRAQAGQRGARCCGYPISSCRSPGPNCVLVSNCGRLGFPQCTWLCGKTEYITACS
jgi:hypothetical protein